MDDWVFSIVHFEKFGLYYLFLFICTFDAFDRERYCYTFENICKEEEGLRLDDGTTKIFLNASGTKGEVSPELKAFLRYVAGNKSDDEFVKELDAEVVKIRISW